MSFLLSGVQQQQSAIPDSGVFRLTFDDADTSGGTALDVWNNNDGTINGATTGVAGISGYDSGQAYDFDGTDDLVDIGQVGTAHAEYSVSVWVELDNTDDGSVQQIVRADDTLNTNIRHFQLRESGGSFEFIQDIGGSSATLTTNATTNVTHLVAVQDASEARLYVDGSIVDTIGNGSSGRDPPIQVGAFLNASDTTDGIIDDPRYYSKALTDSEVSDLNSTGSI